VELAGVLAGHVATGRVLAGVLAGHAAAGRCSGRAAPALAGLLAGHAAAGRCPGRAAPALAGVLAGHAATGWLLARLPRRWPACSRVTLRWAGVLAQLLFREPTLSAPRHREPAAQGALP